MFAETIGPTRTEEDLIAHIEQTVATDSDVPRVFVMDRLNVHWFPGRPGRMGGKTLRAESAAGKKALPGSAQVPSDSL